MADDDYEEYEEDADDVDALKAAEEEKAKEAERLQKAPAETSQQENNNTNADGYDKDAQKEVDARSIYVGNVEYTVDSAELAEFFANCGTVQRVTIPGDRTQHPKGYAYVEFLEPEAVENALKLEGTEIGGRPVKVARKRTNEAGASRGRGGRFGRGRGRGGRGRAYGMMPMPMMFDPSMMMSGYSPYGGRGRGRGRGGRAGGRRQSAGE